MDARLIILRLRLATRRVSRLFRCRLQRCIRALILSKRLKLHFSVAGFCAVKVLSSKTGEGVWWQTRRRSRNGH